MPFIETNGVRALFVHVPKTGGTSVEAWLRSLASLNFFCNGFPDFAKCTPQHLRMRDFNEIFRPGFFDYAFMIVRDPYIRLESEYRMQNALAQNSFFKARPSFSLWLENNLRAQKANPYHLDNHLRPQWELGGDEVEVFKFEDGLEPVLARVAQVLKVPPPTELSRELNTDGSDGRIAWQRTDRLIAQAHYRRDFEESGYRVGRAPARAKRKDADSVDGPTSSR